MLPLLALTALGLAGAACDPSTDDSTVPPVQPLAAPPKGEGVQLTTGNFSVDAGSEQQDCYFFRVRDLAVQGGFDPEKPLILHRTQISYTSGSHHMNIFRVRTILDLDPANGAVQKSKDGQAPCSKSVNWADWPLIANNENEGAFDWSYPEGVGNELMPDEWIMMQSHYVNATTQKTPGDAHVDVNLWMMKPEELKYPMGTLFATKQSIRVCQSNPHPKYSGSCQFNSPDGVHLIGANGHFHSRGKEFGMYGWDGTSVTQPPEDDRFYTSKTWDEPPMARWPELDEPIDPKGGVWYTCQFEWSPPPENIGCEGLNKLDKELFGTPDEQLDCCYTFGNTVDRAEHCNVFAYYYPKTDDVFCN